SFPACTWVSLRSWIMSTIRSTRSAFACASSGLATPRSAKMFPLPSTYPCFFIVLLFSVGDRVVLPDYLSAILTVQLPPSPLARDGVSRVQFHVAASRCPAWISSETGAERKRRSRTLPCIQL